MTYCSHGGFTNRPLLPTAVEAGVRRRGVGRFGFFRCLSSLIGGCFLAVSSCGRPMHVCSWGLCMSSLFFSAHQSDGIRAPLTASFELEHLLKVLTSKQSHTMRHGGVGG